MVKQKREAKSSLDIVSFTAVQKPFIKVICFVVEASGLNKRVIFNFANSGLRLKYYLCLKDADLHVIIVIGKTSEAD